MPFYTIHNPTKARRVIHSLLPNPPTITDDKGKTVPDPLRSHKEIVVDAGATKENVEVDDKLVAEMQERAKKIGVENELQFTLVKGEAAAKTKAA